MKFRGKSCPRSCVVTWYITVSSVRNMSIQSTDIISASRWIYCDVCSLTPNPQLLSPVSSSCASSISPFWVPSAPWNFSDLKYPRQTGTKCWSVSVHFNVFHENMTKYDAPAISCHPLQHSSCWEAFKNSPKLIVYNPALAYGDFSWLDSDTKWQNVVLTVRNQRRGCQSWGLFTNINDDCVVMHCYFQCFCYITACQPALAAHALYWWLWVLLSYNYFRCVETVRIKKLHKHNFGFQQAHTVVLQNLWHNPHSDRKCNTTETMVSLCIKCFDLRWQYFHVFPVSTVFVQSVQRSWKCNLL